MRLSLLVHAFSRKVWLAGFGAMIAGFLLQFSALHFGRLTSVQPILTLELPFLVVILGTWFGHHLGLREWIGTLAATGGLAAFLSLAAPSGGEAVPDFGDWIGISSACVGATIVAVLLTRIGSEAWRAAMFGVSAAIAFAFTAALIKEMNAELGKGWLALFTHWPPYAMAASGLAGVFLAQNAFHTGPITASQSTLIVVDPLASILIGIGLFGDKVRTAGGFAVSESIALVVLFAGVVSLAMSPLVSGVKGDEGGGHLLGARRAKARARKTSVEEQNRSWTVA